MRMGFRAALCDCSRPEREPLKLTEWDLKLASDVLPRDALEGEVVVNLRERLRNLARFGIRFGAPPTSYAQLLEELTVRPVRDCSHCVQAKRHRGC